MKPKLKRHELISNTDITNAVMNVLSNYDFSSEDTTLNKAFIVYHCYSELESGGHESLFRWFGQHIKEMGIDQYTDKLVEVLEEIGAHHYAMIEKKYCKKMWSLYVALEKNEIEEDEFYEVIEIANDAYYKLNDELTALIHTYFVTIYMDLIEVVEE